MTTLGIVVLVLCTWLAAVSLFVVFLVRKTDAQEEAPTRRAENWQWPSRRVR